MLNHTSDGQPNPELACLRALEAEGLVESLRSLSLHSHWRFTCDGLALVLPCLKLHSPRYLFMLRTDVPLEDRTVVARARPVGFWGSESPPTTNRTAPCSS